MVESQKSHRNLALDSLRGFSTILIVVYHTFSASGYPAAHAESFGAYIGRLNVGVAIFFLLSGFLIFRPFAQVLIHNLPLPEVRSFYLKRAARIIPGYWFALFFLAGIDSLTIPNASGFLRNIFLVNPFTTSNVFSGIRQSWTLSVELSFYLLVPVFVLLLLQQSMRKNRPISISTLFLAISLLFIGTYVFRLFHHLTHFWFLETANIWLPSHMDTIGLGMSIAVLVEAPETSRLASKIRTIIANHSGLLFLCSILVWMLSANINMTIGIVQADFHIDLLCHFLYSIASLLLVAPLCVAPKSLLTKILSLRLFAWLGTISYGIYLWHMAFLGGNFAEKYMPYTENDGQVLLRFLVVLPASIAIASLSYYVLERPIMRAINNRFSLKKELRL